MYSVNDEKRFFKTVQDARCHAMELGSLEEDRAFYICVAIIRGSDGEEIGCIARPPDAWTHLGYYWKDAREDYLVPMRKDGYVDKKGFEKVCLDVDGWKFHLTGKNGLDIPFMCLEDALRYYYKASENRDIEPGSTMIVRNSDYEIIGYATKIKDGLLVYGMNKKVREIRANGRLGKNVSVDLHPMGGNDMNIYVAPDMGVNV